MTFPLFAAGRSSRAEPRDLDIEPSTARAYREIQRLRSLHSVETTRFVVSTEGPKTRNGEISAVTVSKAVEK